MAIPGDSAKWDCLCAPLCFGWKCWEDIYAIGKWHQAGRGCKPQGKQDSVRAWCFRKTNSLKVEFVFMESRTRFHVPQCWLGEVPQQTHGLRLATGWTSSHCCVPAKQAMSCGDEWTGTAFQFWGAIQLWRAQQENLGYFDTNFTRMGWLERVQSELTEIIPDLKVKKLQRLKEVTEEGRKHQSLQVWKGRLPRAELQRGPGWKFGNLLMRRASPPALCAASSQRMAEKELFEHPSAHLSALPVLEASSTG